MSDHIDNRDVLNKALSKLHVIASFLENDPDDVELHADGLALILRDVQDDIRTITEQ